MLSLIPVLASPGYQLLDCEDAPKEAVTTVDHERVGEWVKIVCTKYGHVIVPADGYLWSYYGGFAPIAFFAQGTGKDGSLEEVRHSAYYQKLLIKELGEEKSKRIAIAASFNSQIEGEVPVVYAIRGITHTDDKHTFFIQRFSNRLRGAIRCHKPFECDNELQLMPFFVYKADKK